MDKSASDQTNSRSEESYPHEKRNLVVFALNQILMRLGWMFKSESVVIPAFIDVYTSSGTIRGLLPLILRIGQSLPQFLVAQRVAQMPKKQGFFILSGFGFAIPWCVLSLILSLTHWSANVIVAVFLVLCTLHWLAVGCNHLATGTLQGKLISPEKRGRLLAYSNIIGCTLAIGVAFYLLPRWLSGSTPRYAVLFGATATFFGVATAVSFWFKEPLSPPQRTAPFFKFLGDALLSLRYDRNFRRFAIVILLFYSIWPLFPHYTIFGPFFPHYTRKADIRTRLFWFRHVDNCTKCIQCYRCRYHGQHRRPLREPICLASSDINQCLYAIIGGGY